MVKLILVLFLPLVIPASARGDQNAKLSDPRVILYNSLGVKKLLAKENLNAGDDFLKALKHHPLDPRLRSNMALYFMKQKKWENAKKTLESLSLDPSVPLPDRFEVLFNLALVHTQQNQIDKALQAYQGALEIRPDSIEVKTNIELLMMSQSQGGGGQNQDKSGKPQNQKDGKSPENKENKPKPKPQEISKQEMERILEELKDQENRIRAGEMNNDQVEQKANEKDW